jgi:hypothetical protein
VEDDIHWDSRPTGTSNMAVGGVKEVEDDIHWDNTTYFQTEL